MYDFGTHSRIASVELIEPKPVLLVEGILIFAEPELRSQFDIKIFVDAPADIRLIRRLERDRKERGRDGHSVIVQYLSTVRPMHIEFVEPSKRHADVIIPEGGHNKIALDMVISRVVRNPNWLLCCMYVACRVGVCVCVLNTNYMHDMHACVLHC